MREIVSESPLEERKEAIIEGLRAVDRHRVAIFSASVAERFVALYLPFQDGSGRGDHFALEQALDVTWTFLFEGGVSPEALRGHLSQVEELTPHAEDFDQLATTLAQDACICVDSAIRWCLEDERDRYPHVVEYSFEALSAFVCHEKTGLLQLGDSEEGEAFEQALIHDSRVQQELRFQHQDLEDLLQGDRRAGLAQRLRKGSKMNCWTVEKLRG
jgi:uncharacterized protein YjaG (DUF416 family)